LQEQQEKLGEIYRADKENIINELVKIAFFDPRRVVRIQDGRTRIVDTDEITNVEAAAIAEIAETQQGLRVKFHSKVEALDKLAKILGLYVEKHEHAGKDGGPLKIILSQLNPEVFGGGNSSDA
jgi:phage terminase small subunit